jgi:hypothetical protein
MINELLEYLKRNAYSNIKKSKEFSFGAIFEEVGFY